MLDSVTTEYIDIPLYYILKVCFKITKTAEAKEVMTCYIVMFLSYHYHGYLLSLC